MSDIIHLLPDSVANQIAAGEVIQRPASLIKELVENSIDAGATRVQVVVTDAGKTCVQVIDNGKGMSETDARLSFERHATSKITQASDLFALSTMGFRGEALASIAAVAQVELRTRMADEELGVCVQIEGSKFQQQEPIACPVGANFLVRNLFFNLPARRKFLKSNNTELSNINAEFERIALAHPDIAFTLSTPDKVILDLPIGNFRQRIVNIFGRNIEKHLIPVQVETSVLQLAGFVGTPESSKKKGAHQFFFTNGRFMRHPFFAKAIQTAFDRLIPEGEQVPFFLQLVVDPSKIDVNIHPTKTEIKFEDEQAIWQILRAAVREALAKFNAIPTIDFDTENRPDIPAFEAGREVAMPEVTFDPNYNPFEMSEGDSAGGQGATARAVSTPSVSKKGWESLFPAAPDDPSLSNQSALDDFYPTPPRQQDLPNTSLYDNLEQKEQQTWQVGTSHFLQYRGRYLMSPTEEGLLLIDQHRAHVRILFEEYLLHSTDGQQLSQGLLFPQMVDFTPSQVALLQSFEDDLAHIGFDLSYLGGGTFTILGVPTGVDGIDPGKLLQSIVDEALTNHTRVKEEVRKMLSLALAKKAAIPVGQELSENEMRDLATRLFALPSPTLTPDGKTIVCVLPHHMLTSRF